MMLDKLIEYFLKFPGIGPRQAKRFAIFLAGQDKEFLKNLSEMIAKINEQVKQCSSCFHFFESHLEASLPSGSEASKLCNICANLNRDKNFLMVVEKDVDLENFEKSGIYNGKYFVLGGVLPITNNNGKNLRLKELFNKAKKEKPQEIILAMSATIEGENTSRYIEKILEPLRLKITRLGRGLSTGTELEFIDSETMTNALKNRK